MALLELLLEEVAVEEEAASLVLVFLIKAHPAQLELPMADMDKAKAAAMEPAAEVEEVEPWAVQVGL
jgi:hypothetical protein